MHNTIPLMDDARVMLLENVWVDVGLVNGALGTVVGFAWRTNDNPRESPPFVVLIRFDKYTGPACFPGRSDLAGVVLIFRSTRDFIRGASSCTRTQFPLTIAYAITVHKSQGATLDLAVVDISVKDRQSGLTYVAVSRIKTLQGILFDKPFDFDCLRIRGNAGHTAQASDIVHRQRQKIFALPPFVRQQSLSNSELYD